MKPPSALGAAGKALWKSIDEGLPNGVILDEREAAILEAAGIQADENVALSAQVKKEGRMINDKLHPAIAEARQGRLAVGRLLGQLNLPVEDDQPATTAAQRASKAATARWNRKENNARRRRSK